MGRKRHKPEEKRIRRRGGEQRLGARDKSERQARETALSRS